MRRVFLRQWPMIDPWGRRASAKKNARAYRGPEKPRKKYPKTTEKPTENTRKPCRNPPVSVTVRQETPGKGPIITGTPWLSPPYWPRGTMALPILCAKCAFFVPFSRCFFADFVPFLCGYISFSLHKQYNKSNRNNTNNTNTMHKTKTKSTSV